MHEFERDERDGALALPHLARARRERGRSQQDLARISGVSKATITRIETGHRARISSAGKLAEALGTTVRALAGEASGTAPELPWWAVPRAVPTAAAEQQRQGRVVLAMATKREDGEDGEDLEEILGGAEALGGLRELLDGARGGALAGVGLRDYSDAARLAPGEGLSDEIEAQRDARYR